MRIQEINDHQFHDSDHYSIRYVFVAFVTFVTFTAFVAFVACFTA